MSDKETQDIVDKNDEITDEEFCDGESSSEDLIDEIVDGENKIESMMKDLEKAQQDAADARDKLIRSHADIENLRRRHQRELENAHKYSIDKFASELLGVMDSLELGIQAARAEDANMEKIVEGSELTLKMFLQMFEKFSIEPVNPEGQKFDPEVHQAMSMQPVEGVEANQVVAVMQKGYKIADRLLRPAMVMVSK